MRPEQEIFGHLRLTERSELLDCFLWFQHARLAPKASMYQYSNRISLLSSGTRLNPEDSSFSLSEDSSSCDEQERFKHTIVKSHTKRVTRTANLLLTEPPVPIVEEEEVPLRVAAKDVIPEVCEEADESLKHFDKDVFVVTNTTFRDGSFVEVSATEAAESLR